MESKNRRQTLRRKIDFENLKSRGKRQRSCAWLVLNHLPNSRDQFRCGWTIPKKVGSAVVRNRLKRWCREFFRSIPDDELPSIDLNVVVLGTREKKFYKNLSHQVFKEKLSKAWLGLQKNY